MVDGLRKLTLPYHRPNKNRWDLVAAGVVVFIPRHDKQAVVGLGKLNIAVDVLLQPGIARRDRAVMHVVVEIRVDDRNRRQRGEVGREAAERLI